MRLSIEKVYFDHKNPQILEELMHMVVSLLKYFDETETSDPDQTEQTASLNQSRLIDRLPEKRDSVLIFVPGMQHINELTDLLNKELPDRKLRIIPLHSEIIFEQQVRVFEKSEPTWRKVIISTNIAESSITIPDIKYVIDFGLTKEINYDPYTSYTHLRLEWASKSSMIQRLGRAGRDSRGMCYCYRLVTKGFFEKLDDYAKV
jgi:ATP-dependent RNA helicase TDRD9